MLNIIDYKGLNVLDSTAIGLGGRLILDNFKTISDRISTCHIDTVDPTTNNDNIDTAGLGKIFYRTSRWINTTDGSEFICVNPTTGNASWKETTVTRQEIVDQIVLDNYAQLSGADFYGNITAPNIYTKTQVDAIIPSQIGNSGKYLTTNGTALSWGVVGIPSGTNGQVLYFSGTTLTAASADAAGLVAKTGIQTIGGNKSFSSSVTVAETLTATVGIVAGGYSGTLGLDMGYIGSSTLNGNSGMYIEPDSPYVYLLVADNNIVRITSTGLVMESGKIIAGNGSGLTTLNASNLSSGTVATTRLGTGTASSSTYLRGDGTWAAPFGGGVSLAAVLTYDNDGGNQSITNVSQVHASTIYAAEMIDVEAIYGQDNSQLTLHVYNGVAANQIRIDGATNYINLIIAGTPIATITSTGLSMGSGKSITGNGSGLTTLNASNLSSGIVGSARLGSGTANSTTYLRGDGTWATPAGGGGSVTSVSFVAPSEISVSGSPVTTSGTITISWASELANKIFAGPNGSSGTPTFRSLVEDDIPSLSESKITNLTTDLAAKVPLTRTISTTAPITGGGDLSANRTIAISAADGSNAGSMSSAHYTLVNNATDANTINTIVKRNSSGNFTAATIFATEIDCPSFLGTSSVTTFGYVSSGFYGLTVNTTVPGVALTVNGTDIAAVTSSGFAVSGTSSATLFSGSGASLTTLNASNLSSGTVGTARLGSGTASSSTYLRGDGTWATPSAGGSGTVTSVALSLPSEFSVSGSPVTSTGTLTGSWATQTTNKVFAAPNGSTGTPTFRVLVAADIPTHTHSASDITSGTLAVGRGGTGVTSFGGTNTLLYTSTTNTLSSITTANSAVLITNSSGVPSWGTTLPAVNGSALTSLNASNVSSGTLAVARGGTNISSYTTGNILYATGSTTLSQGTADTVGLVGKSGTQTGIAGDKTWTGTQAAPVYKHPSNYFELNSTKAEVPSLYISNSYVYDQRSCITSSRYFAINTLTREVYTYAYSNDTAGHIELKLTAYNPTAGQMYHAYRLISFKIVGGTLTQHSIVSQSYTGDGWSPSVALSVSSGQLKFVFTQASGHNVRMAVTVQQQMLDPDAFSDGGYS